VQLRIVDGLLEALTHEHVWVRRNAADALGTSVPLMTHLGGQPIIQAVIDGLATLACTDTAAHEVEAETPRLSGEPLCFPRRFLIKHDDLPRQAPDKHQRKLTKGTVSFSRNQR
jgi:hypothetical protein